MCSAIVVDLRRLEVRNSKDCRPTVIAALVFVTVSGEFVAMTQTPRQRQLTLLQFPRVRESGFSSFLATLLDFSSSMALVETVFGDGATLGQTANLKRLQFEACTIVIADVKAKVSVSGSAEPAKLPAAKKAARLADQKKRLLGVPIQGNLEPAHSLLDLVAAMAETNVVVYIAPEKCGARMDEIAQITKQQKAVIAIESSTLKVNTPDTQTDADLGSELKERPRL